MKCFAPHVEHFRGARPGDVNVVRGLFTAGVQTICNLERGYFETFHGEINQLAEWTLKSGMLWTEIACGDILNPTFDEIDAVMIILSNPKNGVVYLCCLHGEDRTGLMVCIFLALYCDVLLEEAIRDMYANGYHAFPYDNLGWTQQIRDYCAYRKEHPLL